MSGEKITRRDLLKTLTIGTVVGTVGTTLAACGAGPAGAPTTAAGSSPGTGTAGTGSGSYKGTLVIVGVANAQQNAPLFKGIEDANPGIQITYREMPSERFVELFTAAQVAGDQIDLMLLNGQDLRRYAIAGTLRDLSDIPYKDRFDEASLQTYTLYNKLWALPRGGLGGFTFFYNKKALEKVGVTKELETYDELLKLAPDLQKAGITPFVHPGKNIYLWPIWQFWAFGQTSGNKGIEKTFKTLSGDMKFTDPEHVAALEILYKYAQDKMFIDSVNSLDNDAAFLTLSQGKAAFYYANTNVIALYRKGQFPDLDLSLITPLRSVSDPSIKRELPGGKGAALGIYAKVAPEREAVARNIMDQLTSDKWVKWSNDLSKDPVSTNKNVQASDDPLALKYAKECLPNQVTYLDWYWPPEITRAFQENQQALVSGTKKPNEAAQAIQKTLDDLRKDGYKFEQ